MAGIHGQARWLEAARKRAGFANQVDLADALGVSRGAVGNWESEVSRPKMQTAEKMATILRRPRAEVMATFGYPIGGSASPLTETAPPPEWLTAIRAEIAAGVAQGVAEAIADLRASGVLPAPAVPRRPSRGGSPRGPSDQ